MTAAFTVTAVAAAVAVAADVVAVVVGEPERAAHLVRAVGQQQRDRGAAQPRRHGPGILQRLPHPPQQPGVGDIAVADSQRRENGGGGHRLPVRGRERQTGHRQGFGGQQLHSIHHAFLRS